MPIWELVTNKFEMGHIFPSVCVRELLLQIVSQTTQAHKIENFRIIIKFMIKRIGQEKKGDRKERVGKARKSWFWCLRNVPQNLGP